MKTLKTFNDFTNENLFNKVKSGIKGVIDTAKSGIKGGISSMVDTAKDVISIWNIPLLPDDERTIRKSWYEWQTEHPGDSEENFVKNNLELFKNYPKIIEKYS